MKKSMATISPMWFCKKVFQVCDGGRFTVRKTRETVRSDTDSEFPQLAVNARRAPQRIGAGYGSNQLAHLTA